MSADDVVRAHPVIAPDGAAADPAEGRVELPGGWTFEREWCAGLHRILGPDGTVQTAIPATVLAAIAAALSAPAGARPGDGAVPGIYIASKAVHGPRWRALRDAGWPIISTWIDEAEQGRTTDWQCLWDRCLAEPSRAAVTIVYREDGEELKGARLEAGAALSHGRWVIVIGDVEDTWTRHRNVRFASSLEGAEAFWRAMLAAAPAPRAALEGPATQDTTWFWEIVDREGLADVPSDERGALADLCRRAARSPTSSPGRAAPGAGVGLAGVEAKLDGALLSFGDYCHGFSGSPTRDVTLRSAPECVRTKIDAVLDAVRALVQSDDEDRADATVLRAWVAENRCTPSMMTADRDIWKARAEKAEAALAARDRELDRLATFVSAITVKRGRYLTPEEQIRNLAACLADGDEKGRTADEWFEHLTRPEALARAVEKQNDSATSHHGDRR